MLDEAHVVAGLDARHREERHPLAGAVQRARPGATGDGHPHRDVGLSLPVTVDLVTDRKDKQRQYVEVKPVMDQIQGQQRLPACCRSGSTV